MSRQAIVDEPTPDRFRVAMKASLWAWALYWPGGGLLLLWGGLDPISIGVTVAGVLGLVIMLRSGALDADSSRNMKEYLLERPMYFMGAFFLMLFIVPFFGPIEDAGLRIFATFFLAMVLWAAVELRGWLLRTGTGLRESGADQVFILIGISSIGAFLIFADAWLGVADSQTPSTPATVAAVNWLTLLYPPLLLMVARPFRARLHSPFRVPEPTKATGPVQA